MQKVQNKNKVMQKSQRSENITVVIIVQLLQSKVISQICKNNWNNLQESIFKLFDNYFIQIWTKFASQIHPRRVSCQSVLR